MIGNDRPPRPDLRAEIARAILPALMAGEAAAAPETLARRCADAVLLSRYFGEVEAALAEVLGHAKMTNFVRERLEQHVDLIRRARAEIS